MFIGASKALASESAFASPQGYSEAKQAVDLSDGLGKNKFTAETTRYAIDKLSASANANQAKADELIAQADMMKH